MTIFAVNYQLVDTFENYKEFESLKEVLEWIKGISAEMFKYADLCIEDGVYVEGVWDIINYCEIWG